MRNRLSFKDSVKAVSMLLCAASGIYAAGLSNPVSETGYNETTAECDELAELRKQTADLFQRPLSREEYYERNWMWLRCRTETHNEFDAGGSWFGEDAEDFHNKVRPLDCGPINWHFKYVNGQGWGDAMFGFDWSIPNCVLPFTVQILRDIAKVATDRYQRELYIWDCPGAHDDPHWGTERATGLKVYAPPDRSYD